jgi:VIT1/CCC1 family predicted Fe2+/Mn2+ transporter
LSEALPGEKDAAVPGDARTDRGYKHSFILQVVQPGLAGLMDGSVSTLAPLFATAFATHRSETTLAVGLAAAVGAAISMAFAEGLSDDGQITGRGSPLIRGLVIGLMTFAGGIGHALPFLIHNISVALLLAYLVVGCELIVIALIRNRYFGTKMWLSMVQVVVGGLLVFGAGAAIGSRAGA